MKNDTSKKPTLVQPKDFFNTELKKILIKRNIQTQPYALEYLVNVLIYFVKSEAMHSKTPDGQSSTLLASELYANYIQSSPEEKNKILKQLGDFCLFMTGFFSDSFKRKVVDIDYYFKMGGGAYFTLSQTNNSMQSLFEELAIKFKIFSNAISELSSRTGLQNNSDLLRVYEKWIDSGDEALKDILKENGIIAISKEDWKSIKH